MRVFFTILLGDSCEIRGFFYWVPKDIKRIQSSFWKHHKNLLLLYCLIYLLYDRHIFMFPLHLVYTFSTVQGQDWWQDHFQYLNDQKTYYSFCQVYICCYVLYTLALDRISNRIRNCFLRTFIILWLVCLYCHGTAHYTNLFFLFFLNLSLPLHRVSVFTLEHL